MLGNTFDDMFVGSFLVREEQLFGIVSLHFLDGLEWEGDGKYRDSVMNARVVFGFQVPKRRDRRKPKAWRLYGIMAWVRARNGIAANALGILNS